MTTTTLWVLDKEEQGFEKREIEYVPGIYKIFDEILVNAADNYQRDRTMTKIMIEIDADTNRVSVWNNGKGIPIKIHKEHNIYVAELIFGHLLTSSHYDDTMKKVTGGRNGYGAKLTNIFSERFTVETADSIEQKKLKIVWKNNMSEMEGPFIEDYNGKDYTCVTFIPDLKKFKQRKMSENFIDLMKKRVYDLAGVISEKVKVFLNDKLVDVQGFPSYVDMYLEKATETYKEVPPVIIEKKRHDNWKVIVTLSNDQFQ